MSEDSHIDPTDLHNADPSEGLPEEGPKAGNRPAEGAQQRLPGEVFTDSFQGSENAGDFLGLDLEFTAAEVGPFESATQAEPIAMGNESLDLAAAPGVQSPDETVPEADYDAEYNLDGPTTIMHVDDDLEEVPEYSGELDAEEDGEYDDEDGEYGLLEGEEAQPRSSRKGLLIGAFAAGLAVVAAVSLVPDSTPPVELPAVASAPGGAPATSSDPTTAPESAPDSAPGGELINAAPTLAGAQPLSNSDPSEPEPVAPEMFVDPVPGTPADDAGANGFGSDPLASLTELTSTPSAEPRPLVRSAAEDSFPDFEEGFEWISEDKLDMVWRGEDIPLAAIMAPAKTLMPRVGDVRVHTNAGELIDGRLYAVGRSRVWLDIEGGRLGLDGETVERIERLGAQASTPGEGPLVGAQVRVTLPGGSLAGRVMAQENERLTLLTSAGNKITVDDADVQSVGNGRAVVVQR